MIAILDYKAGNQTSVLRALNSLNIEAQITEDDDTLLKADGVIFPGVGAAAQAMNRLISTGQDKLLSRIVENKIPLLGICLGCQILLEHSDESDTKTLGILPGICRKFPETWKEDVLNEKGNVLTQENIRIPHMGWNSIEIHKDSPILNNIKTGDTVYFVHSFYPEPKNPDEMCIASATYGEKFCSIFGRDGLWAIQFHPEKSGEIGLQILKNFNDYCMKK